MTATTERLDPHRAKARSLLKDVADGDVTPFEGEFTAPKNPPKLQAPASYLDAPLLTLRELMPGSTGEDEEDGELDQSFRADKIEFLVMVRNITAAEKDVDSVLEEVGDIDWDIPSHEEF